jgi:hypothetical protein
MRIPFLIALILAVYVAGVLSQTKPPALASLTSQELKSLVLKFERTGCYGNCPAYRLAIHGDGRVEYEGVRDVQTVGKKTGTISEADLQSILTAVDKANYFSVGTDVSEEKCKCRQCTDFPSVITELTVKDAHHNVDHYLGCGCAMKELYEMEQAIDRLAGVSIWTGDVSKAGPRGATCFNPK